MRRYSVARERLQADVHARLMREAQEGKTSPIADQLRESLRHDASGIVEEFERLAERRSYWRGIWQSFWGSLIFAFAVGAIYIVVLGTRHSLLEIAAGRVPENNTPHPSPTVSPSPSPSATP